MPSASPAGRLQTKIGGLVGEPQRYLQAGGTIQPDRFVAMASDGDVEAAGVGATSVIGVHQGPGLVAGDRIKPGWGHVVVEADMAINPGEGLKAGAAGVAVPHLGAGLVGATIDDSVGTAFTNQPANDGVEVVSASAADTTQTITVIGTTQGTDTVVVETVTLTGTTPVATTKVDWGLILAVKKSAATAGTVTVREASADQAITTLTAAVLSQGVVAVPAADQRTFNVAPTAVAGGASTKQVGLGGTNSAGTQIYDSQALNGTTPVTMNSAFRTVTELYVGDIAGATTVTVKTGAEDDENLRSGVALSAALVAGDLIEALVLPR